MANSPTLVESDVANLANLAKMKKNRQKIKVEVFLEVAVRIPVRRKNVGSRELAHLVEIGLHTEQKLF